MTARSGTSSWCSALSPRTPTSPSSALSAWVRPSSPTRSAGSRAATGTPSSPPPPTSCSRPSSTPGSIADGFAAWWVRQGYTRRSLRLQLRALQRVDRHLRCRRGLRHLREVTRAELRACAAAGSSRDPQLASTAHAVERYLAAEHALPPPAPEPPTRTATQLEGYATYLHDVRGLQPATRRQHLRTAAELLAHLTYEDTPTRL